MRETRRGGGDDNEQVVEDLEGLCVDPEAIEHWRAAEASSKTSDTCVVHPANHDAVRLFLRLQTQWLGTSQGAVKGLDYGGVRTVMASMERWPDDAVFQDIQAMEYAALEALNN